MPTVKMYTTTWCPDCRHAKKFLNERGIVVEEVNVDESPDAEDLVMSVNEGRCKVPTFELNGEFFSCSPFDPYFLSEKFGVPLNL